MPWDGRGLHRSEVAPSDGALVEVEMLDRTVRQSHIRGLRTVGVVDHAVLAGIGEHRDLALGVGGAVCRVLVLVVGGPEQDSLQQTGVRGRIGQTGDVYAAAPSFSDLSKPLKPQRYPTCCPIISLSKKTASAFSLLAISSMISRFCKLIFMPIIFFGIALRILDFIKLLLKI